MVDYDALADGSDDYQGFVVMDTEDVQAVRRRSASRRAGLLATRMFDSPGVPEGCQDHEPNPRIGGQIRLKPELARHHRDSTHQS